MAAFCDAFATRVHSSIAAAPASRLSIFNPCSAAGSSPTALMTEVRPPTQSHIGNRPSQPFLSAYLSNSLRDPVTATACLLKSNPRSLNFVSVSNIPLRVSFVPPDLETTITRRTERIGDELRPER